jgi:hypothetical protein
MKAEIKDLERDLADTQARHRDSAEHTRST